MSCFQEACMLIGERGQCEGWERKEIKLVGVGCGSDKMFYEQGPIREEGAH